MFPMAAEQFTALFSFLCPDSEKEGWEGGQSLDSWPQLTQGISHTIWHHALYVNWGATTEELIGTTWCWTIILCNTWFVYSNSFIIIIIFFLFNLIKLSLLQAMSLSLPTLSPTPLVGGQWLRGCVVLSCQLGVNHNNWMNLLNAHCIIPCSSFPVDTQAPKHMSSSLKMLLELRRAVSLTPHLWQSCDLGIPQILNWNHERIFSHLFIFYGNAA